MEVSKQLARLFKQPDPNGYEAELSRWQDFNVSFKAWLFYGDGHFEVDFHRVEAIMLRPQLSVWMVNAKNQK